MIRNDDMISNLIFYRRSTFPIIQFLVFLLTSFNFSKSSIAKRGQSVSIPIFASNSKRNLSLMTLNWFIPNSKLLDVSPVDRQTELLKANSTLSKILNHLSGYSNNFASTGMISRLKRSTCPLSRGVAVAIKTYSTNSSFKKSSNASHVKQGLRSLIIR
jgi:hypothetical protein